MKALFWGILLAILCFALPAEAQYGNHRMGINTGVMNFRAKDMDAYWGFVPIAPEYTIYIESGFDVGFKIPLVILFDRVHKQQHLATGLSANFRYLFMEEYFRPYLGLQLGGIYIFRRNLNSLFFDIGPIGGFDYFISSAWSIGPRLFVNFHFMLNERVHYSLGGFFAVHTYF